MKVNQGFNAHNSIGDIAQYPFQRSILEEDSKNILEPKSTNRPGALPGASDVALSKEGLAASMEVDFASEKDNLNKLTAFGKSGGLSMSHAAISYENVKHLLD